MRWWLNWGCVFRNRRFFYIYCLLSAWMISYDRAYIWYHPSSRMRWWLNWRCVFGNRRFFYIYCLLSTWMISYERSYIWYHLVSRVLLIYFFLRSCLYGILCLFTWLLFLFRYFFIYKLIIYIFYRNLF